MIVERITTPENLPYRLSDVELHLRVDGGDSVEEVSRLAKAAAAEVERFCQVALLTQTIRVTLFGWPGGRSFPLPIGPVLVDATASMTVDGEAFTDFDLMTGERPQLRLAADPTELLICGRIVIEYPAGFGETHQAIPADLAHAVMDQAAALFDGRGGYTKEREATSPSMARISARYRRVAL